MVDVVAALPGPLAHGSDTPARDRAPPGRLGRQRRGVARGGRRARSPSRAAPATTRSGDAAVAALGGVALAVERDPERPTGTCIVLVHPGGERTMIPDAGANDALELRELPGGAHLHLTGYTLLREGSRPAALRALAAGARARDDGLRRPVVGGAAGRRARLRRTARPPSRCCCPTPTRRAC